MVVKESGDLGESHTKKARCLVFKIRGSREEFKGGTIYERASRDG